IIDMTLRKAEVLEKNNQQSMIYPVEKLETYPSIVGIECSKEEITAFLEDGRKAFFAGCGSGVVFKYFGEDSSDFFTDFNFYFLFLAEVGLLAVWEVVCSVRVVISSGSLLTEYLVLAEVRRV
ncbi:3913_t:CDS:2, partial [Diversispora eburnea]